MSTFRRNLEPFTLLLLFCFLLSFPSPLQAAEATLSDIIVTNTQEDLLIFFDIQGSFTREMEEAILNGIPTTFTIVIKLNSQEGHGRNQEHQGYTIERTSRKG
ncbi:MAG: DUF4390 domain-containing protein [Deltaproteobacteria bacterium]|nr:DUF4390 domain-containing protein [Deltaproteobacteria bacterium]